ncbi:S26 family signal peptidase [Streptomyces sp. NPDC046853]|uniref:S26 family signal peptidase n=1 Tax=Streptomyces sp. NPDC046853 TaxID=3154920 RepID=UPI0033E0C66D
MLKDLDVATVSLVLAVGVTAFGAAVLLRVLRRTFVVVTVTGLSMQPAYEPGDRVIVWRGRVPAKGGEAVVEMPSIEARAWAAPAAGLGAPGVDVARSRWLIKRVVAEPGDVWAAPTGDLVEVPTEHLFLLGDNARLSFDSRHMGPFGTDRVLGSVCYRF